MCFFNNCIEKNQNKTQFEEGSNSHTSVRAGSRYQIKWIFGKVPNGSWPHPSEWSLSLEIMYMHFILSGPRASLHIVDHIHYKEFATLLSENERAGLKAVWNFSKNSSDLVRHPSLSTVGCFSRTTKDRATIKYHLQKKRLSFVTKWECSGRWGQRCKRPKQILTTYLQKVTKRTPTIY